MKLPKTIAKLLKRAECLQRKYPNDRPNLEQIVVYLESLALGGTPIGFMVTRSLYKDKPVVEKFYEPYELPDAIEEYQKNTLPENSGFPVIQKKKTFEVAPKIVQENKRFTPSMEM